MIFTSYFNFFNNKNRKESIETFKNKYPVSIVSGIQENDISFDHTFKSQDKIFLKENLLNLAIKKHIHNADYVFWIDNDVCFEDLDWYSKALEKFEEGFDVLQLFDSCYHLDKDNKPLTPVSGFVYAKQVNNRHGHCGFAWAMKKSVFEHLGGLYDMNIAGTGDAIMARSFIQEKMMPYPQSCFAREKFAYYPYSENHYYTIQEFFNKCKHLKTSYLTGKVYHNYHGELDKRNYIDRYKIYENNRFDPLLMLRRDNGIIQIKEEYKQLKSDIEQFLHYKDSI